jgi:hypothetical protein
MHNFILLNRIVGIMVSVLASSAVDCGFELRSGQTKDYEIGICCFSAKHTALRRKSKDWLAWNQNNVSSGATCLDRLKFSSYIVIKTNILFPQEYETLVDFGYPVRPLWLSCSQKLLNCLAFQSH